LKYLDGPMCVRELKPGVQREGHALTDHVDYNEPCRSCGEPVEPARRCYAIPTCYACLPPPEPLPVSVRP
jgi:hypothetical protein